MHSGSTSQPVASRGAGPVELLEEAASVLLRVVPVADHERVHAAPGGRAARAGTRRPWARTATCARCPCSTRRRARRAPSGTMPGACAPSTSVSTPRSRSAATSRSIGKHERGRARHVVEQREPRARRDAASTRSTIVVGGVERERDRAPSRRARPRRRATNCAAFRHALYAWSVVSISSPGASSSQRSTAFTPAVAFADEREVLGPARPGTPRPPRARRPSAPAPARAPGSRPARAPSRAAAPTAAPGSRAGRRRTSRGSGSRPSGSSVQSDAKGEAVTRGLWRARRLERHAHAQPHVAARQRREVLQERDVVARLLRP